MRACVCTCASIVAAENQMVYPLTCTIGPPYWREKSAGEKLLVAIKLTPCGRRWRRSETRQQLVNVTGLAGGQSRQHVLEMRRWVVPVEPAIR